MPGLFRQLDTLINRGARRNAVQMQQLKSSQPKRNQNLGIELRVRPFQQSLQLVVELNLPPKYAENQRSRQIAIGGGECIDCFPTQQII